MFTLASFGVRKTRLCEQLQTPRRRGPEAADSLYRAREHDNHIGILLHVCRAVGAPRPVQVGSRDTE